MRVELEEEEERVHRKNGLVKVHGSWVGARRKDS